MIRIVLLLVALLAAWTPAANAASVDTADGALRYFGVGDELNRVTIVLDGDGFRITDPGAIGFSSVNCQVLSETVVCPAAGITSITVGLGDGDDQLAIAVALPAMIQGGAGADLVLAGDGADVILGGPGSDTIRGGGGDDLLVGGDGDNVLDGGPGADRLRGGTGREQLFGGPGDDSLAGDDGDDLTDGGEGDDLLDGGSGPLGLVTDADRLIGGPGFDTLTYVLNPSQVTVSLGDDVAGDGAPGEGDDARDDVEKLIGSYNADVLTGGPADNVIDGNWGADVIDGGGGDDLIVGGDDDAAGDTLRGGSGRDRLSGGAGDDALDGGADDDQVGGGTGDDALAGGLGADVLNGDDGDDRLEGGADPDVLSGGPGTDTVRYTANVPVEVTLDGVANDGSVAAVDGRTRVEEGGRSEGDNVDATNERVDGSSVDDTVSGNAGANTLSGELGEDYLDGGGSSDVLTGGARSDTIMARDGQRDRVSCGSGSDYVVADPGDVIDRAADCEYIDDGRTARPSALRDITVAPACGRGFDADLSPPDTRRSVPLKTRARVPVGSRVDSLDCELLLTAAVAGGKTAGGSLGRGSGAMAITQTRAGGQVLTRMRTTDCPTRARIADARAHATRYPRGSYRRRYGRFAIPVELRLDTALITSRRGVASWEVDDRCGKSATVRVASGRLTVVDLATDRRVVLGPGDSVTTRAAK